MFKIDIHTHILPKNIPNFAKKYGYGGFISLDHHAPCRAKMMKDDQFFREIEHNCWDPNVRENECKQIGISVQVLSTIPVMFSYWAKPNDTMDLAMYLNDHIAEIVAKFPKRFVGLGTLPMQDPDLAVRELERIMKFSGMAGVQIGSHINDWNLNDAKLYPFYEAAEKLEAAIFVHPWDMMGAEKMQKYWLPWLVGMPAETSLAICSMIFGGIFEKFPRLRVAFAHGGGSFPSTIGRIAHGFQERPDLCAIDNNINPREYIGRFYVDSLVHDSNMLRFLIQTMGLNQIALGSDYPFPLGELRAGELIDSMEDLAIEAKERLFYGTALEWLNMKKEYFEA